MGLVDLKRLGTLSGLTLAVPPVTLLWQRPAGRCVIYQPRHQHNKEHEKANARLQQSSEDTPGSPG